MPSIERDNEHFQGGLLPKPGTIWVPVDDIVIAATPKVASTAIRRLSGRKSQVPAHRVPLYPLALVPLREPLTRLESAFNYFKARNGFPFGYDPCVGYSVHHMYDEYEAFVDAVLAGYLDKHWMPQMHNTEGLGTEYVALESLPLYLMERGLRLEKRVNASGVPKTAPKYRRPELEAFYKADYEQWEALQ